LIKLLIFDYDGVLFDTKNIAFNLVTKACKKFCNFTIDNWKDFIDIYKSNFYDAMRKRGARKKDIVKMTAFSIKELEKKTLHVHPGIKSVVEKLSKTHTLAVISSNYDNIMRKNLKKNGILDDFHYILGTEEGESKRKKIADLLKKTKTEKSEAVFITDTVGDIKEAKKSGIKAMAVTWGFHSKAMLKKQNPDFIAENAEQIQEALA